MNNIIYNRVLPRTNTVMDFDPISKILCTQENNGAAVWTESTNGDIDLVEFFVQAPREDALELATKIGARLYEEAEEGHFYAPGTWHECPGLEHAL